MLVAVLSAVGAPARQPSVQLQAPPWIFGQMSTCKKQEASLQQHAVKKALAKLLIRVSHQPN